MQEHARSRPVETIVDRVMETSRERERVSVEEIAEAVGRQSFGPLLLIAGLVLFSPLSGIPGVPTLFGLMILFICVQLLIGRREFWLPGWVLSKQVGSPRLSRGLDRVRPAARWMDQRLSQRMTWLLGPLGRTFISLVCLFLALVMPFMELVPFSATSAGLGLIVFGLAITANDGIMALAAYSLTFLFVAFFVGTALSA